MFGLGNVKQHEMKIEAQEEMIDNLLDEHYALREKCVKLENALIKAQQGKTKKKRKPQLSRKTGYKIVTADESLEMLEMYNNGYDLTAISNFTGRSSSCVSRHIRKHLGE